MLFLRRESCRKRAASTTLKRSLDPRPLLPAALVAVAAVAVWLTFRPGLLSYDSIDQYRQALTGAYTDWHPPLLSLLLHAVLALGGSLGGLMLGQCLAGALGVFAFLWIALRRLYGERLPPRLAAGLACGAFLALLIPVSPLAFYLMTFWKDVWVMILLLWTGALSLGLVRAGDSGRGPSALRVAVVVLLGAALGMIRHNAVVMLPFLGLLLGIECRRWGRGRALLLAVAPLAVCLALDHLVVAVFHVKEIHPDSQVMVFDLAGLCAEDRAACGDLPLLRRFLRVPDYQARYRPGDIGSIFWEPPVILDSGILSQPLHGDLVAEYRRAIERHPFRMMELKAEAFWPLLGTRQTYYFFHDSVVENAYGLALAKGPRPVRERLAAIAGRMALGRLRWIAGVHLVWLAANAAWIVALLARWRWSGEERFRALALFLLMPLAYYFSYLLAAPVPDFRFMYPSTLLIQGLTLAALGGAGISSRQKPSGRAPYQASVSE
jgi:hypothetical protein